MATTRLECIDDEQGLFSAELLTSKGWSLRSAAFRLADGDLAIMSPTKGLLDTLAPLGRPAALIAPNHFHHMGLATFRDAYPDAEVYATAVATPRIARKTGLSIRPIEELRARLGAGTSLVEPPGLRTGELFLRAPTRAGIAWFVTDAFFHLPEHPHGLIGAFCKLTQTSPGLRIGRTFTTLAVRDRSVYRQWLLQELDSDRPRVLVPAHGDILRDQELTERLLDLARVRLS